MRRFGTVFLCVFGLASSVRSLDNDDVIPAIDMPEGPFNGTQRDADWGPFNGTQRDADWGPFNGTQRDADWISWAGEFEGDMKLTQSQLRQLNASSSERNGILGDKYRWPDRKIPYVITGDFLPDEVTKIETAFASYANNTCLRMVRRTTEADYVDITRDGGCWSYVGRQGGKQQLSLAHGCVYQATIIHEFMHASGFFHEQSRTDRDTYVRIALENVQDGLTNNFNTYSASQITAFGEPYDYESVMHYGAYDFSKNGQKTIVRLDGSQADLGNKVGFSQVDINKLNAMYCATTTVTTAGPTTTGSCTDTREYEDKCLIWENAGYCTPGSAPLAAIRFLRRNCKKSCGFC